MSRPDDRATDAGNEPGVLIEDVDHIRLVTLNRPQVRNAIDRATAEAIENALVEFDADDDLRVAVLTGAGPTFCAGMDLQAFLRGERPTTDRGGFAGLVESPPGKPLIAAVNGPAVAGGFEIALACDLIVAAEGSFFALPEVSRGLVAAGGGLLRLPARLPYHVAMEMALTGQRLSAADALRYGLVNRVVPRDELYAAAMALAAAIAANGPLAVRATKRIVTSADSWSPAEAFDRQREISEPVRASTDATEGARAFREKRAPRWTGH